MNPRNVEDREELLVGLMADYDEALAADAPTDRIDETAAEFDPELAAEWEAAKDCLALLNRARRGGEVPRLQPETLNGIGVSSPGRRRLGRFVLERELGRGGLGIVYLAHDERLGRKVAVKIPRFQALLDHDLRRRFLREAEAAARLNHPQLVALYEVGEENSICYLASEYCPGPTLAQWLRAQTERVPHDEAARLVLALTEAVEHAHSRGVLHRDIKPSNVMLCDACEVGHEATNGNRWSPKLTDFGMAKLLEQDGGDRTRTGAIIGTLAYMAPEQLEGRTDEIDARTDVYALGTILYELLTGAAPYGGQSDAERPSQLLVSEPVAPRKLRRDVPRDLEAIVLKCLANRQSARYESASALAAELQRFLAGQPTVARPLRMTSRLVRWTKRRPAIAALWCVSVLAVAFTLGINSRRLADVGLVVEQSNRFRTLAEEERRRAGDEALLARRVLYASRMRKAQQAWHDGNLQQMRGILQDYGEGTPEEHLRHFEWYHLNYLANLPHRVFRSHQGDAYAVAYAPDGKTIVSGGQDGTVRLWNVASGEMLTSLHEHTSCVNSVDFSPDGDTFITASCDKTIKLWSLARRTVLATLSGPGQKIDDSMFIDNGHLLVSLSHDLDGTGGLREARIWDVATRSMRSDWPPADERVQAFVAAKSGKTFVTFADNRAAVWKRVGNSWALNHRFNTDNPIREVLFSPDEEYIIVPVWPRQLQTIRVRDGAVVNEWKEHSATITHMAFSPAGDRLAAAFSDNTIRVFEFPSGRPEHLFLGHSKRAWQVAWSPAEDALASVGEDGTVRLWDLKQGSQRLHFKLPTKRNSTNEQVEDFAYLKDGVHVSGICEGKSFVWDVTTGKSVSSDQVAEPGTKVYAPPVVDALFPGAMSNVLAKWDPQSIFIRPRHSLDVIGRPIGTSNSIRVRRDGSEIVQIWYDKLRRWSIEPLELIDERTIGSPKSFDVVFDISHDGKRVCGVSVGDGRPKGPVKICDLNQATCVALEKFEDIREAHFSPGGDRVVLMSPGVPEYDAYTGAKIREYVDRSIPLGTINYSADGQRLAVYSLLGYTTIHDVATGEETIRLEGGAVGLLFASDGTSMVMSGAPDGGLFFWPGKK